MSSDDFRDVGLIVAGGGSGTRFGGGSNKLLRELNGVPVVCWCLRTFLAGIPPASAVLLTPAGLEEDFRSVLRLHGIPEGIRIAPGGATRQDSVYAGLQLLPPQVRIVAIQDGARPFSTLQLLSDCVKSARLRGSGVAAFPVTDTIKVVDSDGKVISTPDRKTLWAAETPQVFQRDLIEKAYDALMRSGRQVTDDAQAMELSGLPVFLVEHAGHNRKITFPTDLQG